MSLPSSSLRSLEVEGSVELAMEGNYIQSRAIATGVVRSWTNLNNGAGVYTVGSDIPTTSGSGTGMTVNITRVSPTGVIIGLTLNYNGLFYQDGSVIIIVQGGTSTASFILRLIPTDGSAPNIGVPYPTVLVGKQGSGGRRADDEDIANYPQPAYLEVVGNTYIQTANSISSKSNKVSMGGNLNVGGTINGLFPPAPYFSHWTAQFGDFIDPNAQESLGTFTGMTFTDILMTPNSQTPLGNNAYFMFSEFFAGLPDPPYPIDPLENGLRVDDAFMMLVRPLYWQLESTALSTVTGENYIILSDVASADPVSGETGGSALNLQRAVELFLGQVSDGEIRRDSSTALAYGDWVSVDITVLIQDIPGGGAQHLSLLDSAGEFIQPFVLGTQSGFQPRYSPPQTFPPASPWPQTVLLHSMSTGESWMAKFRISLRCGDREATTVAAGGPQFSVIKLMRCQLE